MNGEIVCIGYIDPGAGSLILQVLIGGTLGFLFLIRNKIRQLVDRIRGKKPSDS